MIERDWWVPGYETILCLTRPRQSEGKLKIFNGTGLIGPMDAEHGPGSAEPKVTFVEHFHLTERGEDWSDH